MKKIFIILLSIVLIANNVLAEELDIDSNAGGGGISGAPNNVGADSNIYYDSSISGIRIGFFKNGDATCIARLDIVNNPQKAGADDIRCLKGQLTKIELATMYDKDELKDYINPWRRNNIGADSTFPKYNENKVYGEKMSFPSMKATYGDNSERIQSIKNYFLNEEKYLKLVKAFKDGCELKDEYDEAFKSKDYTLCIEPLVLVSTNRSNFSDKGKDRYLMTIAEYAAVGLVEECWWGSSTYDRMDGCKFPTGKLSGSVYKAFPLGVYFEETDYIIGLPASSITTLANAISNKGQIVIMLKSMGAFDLSCGTNMQEVQKNPEKNLGIINVEYYTDIYVITSVEVFSEQGFPTQSKTPQTGQDLTAKNNALNNVVCEVNFTINVASGSITKKGSIKEQESRLFWVKWKTPKEHCQVYAVISDNEETDFYRNYFLYLNQLLFVI